MSDSTIWSNLITRIHGSSVTILILTEDLLSKNRFKISSGDSFENSGWIYKEISASLRDFKNNSINGVFVIFEDKLDSKIYDSSKIKIAKIIDRNMNNKITGGNYIDLVSYSNFISNPKKWVLEAKNKREEQLNYKQYKIQYDFHN